MNRTISLAFMIGAFSVTVGCSSTMPPRDAAVESARRDFLVIAQEPYIQQYAPIAYANAKKSIDETERLWREGASAEELEHQAYLARKKVAIAREEAGLNRSEQQIDEAEGHRKDVLLEAREQQLQSANRRAATAEEQAEFMRMDAEHARGDAERMQSQAGQLSQELSDIEARQTERGLVITLNNILFDSNKAELKPGADNSLDRIASVLQEHPEHSLVVEGFTDSLGEEKHNAELSGQRAEAVKSALVQRGVSADRIDTRGYGERFPIATNDTSTGRQLNRRVEIIVSNDQNPVGDRST
ncbi:MAG TPA: OmpA family protein [Gammaproteobacteria bacterium]|nr:OmpA family protein [Gammaproteobacteria bacterium]